MADIFIDNDAQEIYLDETELELANFVAEEMYKVYFKQSNNNISAQHGINTFLDMKLSAIKAFKKRKSVSSVPVEGINSEYLKNVVFVTKQYIIANASTVTEAMTSFIVEKIAENAFEYKNAALATIAQIQFEESENYRMFK